jgi:hypothetical protein
LATWERKKEYQLDFRKAIDLMQEFDLLEDLKKYQPELLDFAFGLIEKFNQKKYVDENLKQSYEIVVSPMHQYIVAEAKPHPKVTELVFILQNLSNQYRGIELAAEHNARDYELYATQLKKIAVDLIACTRQLQGDFKTISASS